MRGSSFATTVGTWPKRDEAAFQRGKPVRPPAARLSQSHFGLDGLHDTDLHAAPEPLQPRPRAVQGG